MLWYVYIDCARRLVDIASQPEEGALPCGSNWQLCRDEAHARAELDAALAAGYEQGHEWNLTY